MICGNCENGEFCRCIDCDLNFDCGASCASCQRDEDKKIKKELKDYEMQNKSF